MTRASHTGPRTLRPSATEEERGREGRSRPRSAAAPPSPSPGLALALTVGGAVALAIAPAGSASAQSPVACMPELEGPVPATASSRPYRPPGTPPPPDGYVDEEYFVSCEAEGATYRTTLTVRRPGEAGADAGIGRTGPAEASGVVIVEPTHPGNIWPVLSTARAYLARAGHASVAVSTTPSVVQRLVKPTDPERYADLTIPGQDGIENAILAQVGTLLKVEGVPNAPVEHVILAGYSGTGAMVRSYIEARHDDARLASGDPIFDGYFPGQTAVGTMPGPIPDLDVPVVEVQGEREVIATFDRNPDGLTYRRPDGDLYRLYEVPGMAHLDTRNDDRSWVTEACDIEKPSTFPLSHVWDVALRNLVRWVRHGEPAPHAERIALEEDGRTIARDAHGNARGGMPHVYIDVPAATYRTVSERRPGATGGRCDMVGPQRDFSPDELRELYGSREEFLRRFDRRLDELVRRGWYLDFHADELRREARELPEFQEN